MYSCPGVQDIRHEPSYTLLFLAFIKETDKNIEYLKHTAAAAKGWMLTCRKKGVVKVVISPNIILVPLAKCASKLD